MSFKPLHCILSSLPPLFDTDLEKVIETLSQKDLNETAKQAIYISIRDVLQTPKTAKVKILELEKVSKTYLGTRVEIELRDALGLKKGLELDYSICGIAVDCKHTIGKAWMIPKEAIGKICILVATDYDRSNKFSLGIARISPEMLPLGENQDGKKSLRCSHEDIRWLVRSESFPFNIYKELNEEQLSDLFDASVGASKRLAKLFRCLPGIPIPRCVIEDVAGQKDYMKRVRSNGGAQDHLPDLDILCGTWADTALKLQSRGLRPIGKDEFIAIPHLNLEVQVNFDESPD